MTIRARVYDDTVGVDPYRELRMDLSTHSLQVVDYAHHEIHSGSSFHVSYSEVTANSDNDVSAIMLKTSNTTKWIHMVVSFNCATAAEAVILEAPTLAD